jgi:hypothetical protein
MLVRCYQSRLWPESTGLLLNSMVEPLGYKQLRINPFPCFHGGGLLPENCNRGTVMLTQGMFAPKGKWVMHNLTVKEVLIAKDCGRVAVNLLGSGNMAIVSCKTSFREMLHFSWFIRRLTPKSRAQKGLNVSQLPVQITVCRYTGRHWGKPMSSW